MFGGVEGAVIHGIDVLSGSFAAELEGVRNHVGAILAESFVRFGKSEGWGGFVFRSQKFFEAVCRVGRFPGGVPLCTVGNDCGAGGAFQDLADFCPAVHDRLFFQKGVGSAVGALDGITGFHFAFPEFFFPLPPSSRRSEDFFGTLCFSG